MAWLNLRSPWPSSYVFTTIALRPAKRPLRSTTTFPFFTLWAQTRGARQFGLSPCCFRCRWHNCSRIGWGWWTANRSYDGAAVSAIAQPLLRLKACTYRRRNRPSSSPCCCCLPACCYSGTYMPMMPFLGRFGAVPYCGERYDRGIGAPKSATGANQSPHPPFIGQ